jgi:hypothetical protein
MLCLVLSVLTPVLGAEITTSSNRFLFIIDTSAAMKPLEMPLRETAFDLIYSGARGRMTNGDTYGVWLVSDRTDTSFIMEMWKQKHNVELAAKAAAHVKARGLKGKAHFELALADVQRILKSVGDLTVILVTDGSTPILGTPFDEEINTRWQELAPALKRAKATLNTALVAQDGEFVAWAVNSPDFLLEVPIVAPKPKPVKAAPLIAKANVPALPSSKSDSVAATVPPPKPRIAAAPIIITKETVAKERLSYLSLSTTSVEEPAVVTNPTPAVIAVTVPATNLAVVTPTTITNVAVARNPTPEVPSTNTASYSSPKPVIESASDDSETVAITPTPSRAGTLSALQQKLTRSVTFLWVGVGAGAVLGCLLILRFVLRRRYRETSLISQALDREKFSLR